jgi:predicted transcriptional regulator
MKTVTVSPRSKAVNTLLNMAQESVLLLQAADGRQFVLTPITDLQAFYVGDSDDLVTEISIARANQALMKFLDERGRQAQPGKGTSIEEVRRQLELV